jgi:hypothetical protein
MEGIGKDGSGYAVVRVFRSNRWSVMSLNDSMLELPMTDHHSTWTIRKEAKKVAKRLNKEAGVVNPKK